jgi:hypothetical protein
MKQWTPQHQALLDALRSAHVLPRLIRRLTQERYTASEAELVQLGEWPSSLKRDAGWAAIEPMLDSPRAWPAAWDRAVALGFSATSDHHNALYLCRLAARALADDEAELAWWAWQQGYAAWRRVLAGPYMLELLADLVEPDAALEAERRAVVTHLLDGYIDERAAELAEGLGLRRALADGAPAAMLRRQARFGADALRLAAAPVAPDADPTGALRQAAALAARHIEALQREAAMRFEAMLKEQDAATGAVEALLAPFVWVEEVSAVIGADDALAIPVIEATVELGWTLRKVKRDKEQDLLLSILNAIAPINQALEARLLKHESLGYNSKCADVYVFLGEQSKGAVRRDCFARALAVCPGHRNAAMLMSYELLAQADNLLTLSKASGLLSQSTPQSLVREAEVKIAEAAALYPPNKELEGYRARLKEAAARAGVTLKDEGGAGGAGQPV